jgi:hypothetical protein
MYVGGWGPEVLFLSAAGGVPHDTFLTENLLNLSDTASGECKWEAKVLRLWGGGGGIPQDTCLTDDILNLPQADDASGK